MKINNIFSSIQGEGKYQGKPVIFVRVSGCTRKCYWCDSKYHTEYKEMTIEEVVKKIEGYKGIYTIVWTGGEPLMRLRDIEKVGKELFDYDFFIETNGDLIKDNDYMYRLKRTFNYICVSPKEFEVAKRVREIIDICLKKKYLYRRYRLESNCDIKVVTDLDKVGVEMLPYATMLMPLSTYDREKDQEIRKKVWKYCVKNNKFYSARLHVDIFGKKKGV